MLRVQDYLLTHSLAQLWKERGVKARFSTQNPRKFSLNYDDYKSCQTDPISQECRGLVLQTTEVIDDKKIVGATEILAHPMHRFFNYNPHSHGYTTATKDIDASSATAVKTDGSTYDVTPTSTVTDNPMTVDTEKSVKASKRPPGKSKSKTESLGFEKWKSSKDPPIDFTDPQLTVFEKHDGTLCIVYHDPALLDNGHDGWCVATRAVPDADIKYDKNSTFSDLFWKAFDMIGGTFDRVSEDSQGKYTFCFELCTPENTIVVEYPDYQVFLLAVIETLPDEKGRAIEHLPSEWVPVFGVPSAIFHQLAEDQQSVPGLMTFVSSRPPSKHEGVVVCNSDFHRYKIKSPSYLALTRAKAPKMHSPKSFMEVILAQQIDDVLPHCSVKVRDEVLKMADGLRTLIERMDEEYDRLYHEDREIFVLAIQNSSGYLPPQIARWSGKCDSFSGWIASKRFNGSWDDSFLRELVKRCESATAAVSGADATINTATDREHQDTIACDENDAQ